jgi:hypothetical protein
MWTLFTGLDFKLNRDSLEIILFSFLCCEDVETSYVVGSVTIRAVFE